MVRGMVIQTFGLALICCIEVEIIKIDPTKKSRFRVKITAGNEKPTETEEIKIDRVGVTLKWAMTKSL